MSRRFESVVAVVMRRDDESPAGHEETVVEKLRVYETRRSIAGGADTMNRTFLDFKGRKLRCSVRGWTSIVSMTRQTREVTQDKERRVVVVESTKQCDLK